MMHRSFANAREMEGAALRAAAEGELVLAPTSRLAKRYRHARRMEALRTGREQAWETPEIAGFARWVRTQYDALWESGAILPKAGQLRFWSEAFDAVQLGNELKAGIRPTPSLYSKLQHTYDLLCQKGGNRAPRIGEGLAGWRGEVVAKFEALVKKNGYCCWDVVLGAVGRAVEVGRLPCARKVACIVTDEVQKLHEDFYSALEKGGTQISLWSLAGSGSRPSCKVYATPEQECRAVCHEAREAWNSSGGCDYLGIVPLDESYFPLLGVCLDELSGRAGSSEGQARFNLAWGIALPEHPLFQTAVLPLRLVTDDNPAALLSSLLCSPFVGDKLCPSPPKIREALWPENRSLGLDEALEGLAKQGLASRAIVKGLKPFASTDPRPLGKWVADLRAAWSAVGFPHWGRGVSEPVRDARANAWEGLNRTLEELERLADRVRVGPDGALDWIRTTGENRQVVSPGAESGGIQVLSLKESFGIPFDRLWVVGCHGGVLPSPRPAEPLVTPDEQMRNSLGRKAHEEAWEKATRDLAALQALCPVVQGTSFTRAATAPGDSPFLSSPLLTDAMDERAAARSEKGKKTKKVPFLFDIWQGEKAKWLSAPWLADAERGWVRRRKAGAPDPEAVPGAVPAELSVTQLEKLLWCPFRYFAEEGIGLKPMPVPPDGIAPTERGTFVHDLLRDFVSALSGGVPLWPEETGPAWKSLKGLTEEKLEPKLGMPEWRSERRWLLGDDAEGTPGVLRAWLEAEKAHWKEGWRPVEGGLEAKFRGLEVGTAEVTLHGKVDRIDEHPDFGRWVIDYKTGILPDKALVFKHLLEPQLPAYSLAVMKGLPGAIPREPWEGPIQAGYVGLKKAAEVEFGPLVTGQKKEAIDRAFVATWEEKVAGRLGQVSEGTFPASPGPDRFAATRKKKPCEHCEMEALCCFYDDPARALAESEEGGGE